MLELLRRWRDAGWLRSLDAAFAAFIHELDPDAPASLLLAAALLVHVEGRGQSCLQVRDVTDELDGAMAWPPAAKAELAAALVHWPADEPSQRAAWGASPVVQFDPADEAGASPLVLCDGRLYLRRYWRYESRMTAQIGSRTHAAQPAGAATPSIDPGAARFWLDRLFAPTAGDSAASNDPAEVDWQKIACALALRERLTIITGGPGTGKTYTAARVLVLLQALHPGPRPLRVTLAAPTGKAAARLRQSIAEALHGMRQALGASLPLDEWAQQLGPARTLHALLGARAGTRRLRHDAANLLEVDVIFVDEVSMVDLEMMASLLEALPAAARVILLGDKDQLASVEAGAVMGDLCRGADPRGVAGSYWPATAQWIREITGQELPLSCVGAGSELAQQTVLLRQSHRFSGPIGDLARAVNEGDGAAAIEILSRGPAAAVSAIEARDAGVIALLAVEGKVEAPGGYRTYLECVAQRPADTQAFDEWARTVLERFDGLRVLCAVREGPWGVARLNVAIEDALAAAGLLQRRGEWYEGRPVMVTRNAPDLGVFNGDIGVVLESPSSTRQLRAYFLAGAELRSVSVGRLADVETAFAMTVHKSQGSEFEHVVLVLPAEDTPVLTRELVYTGITRARRTLTLVGKSLAPLVFKLAAIDSRAAQAVHRADATR